MIDKSAYTLRISQASPAGLVVINFELIIEFLNEAETTASSDKEAFRTAVSKAKSGIEELIQSLDFDVPVSHDFYEIYNYSYKLLCDIHFSSDTEAACSAVKEAREHLSVLLEGWRETAEKADAEAAELGENSPKSDGVPKIYTGLTYGKNGMANEYIDENKDRGYMA
ncbi:MAG: flagellar protein FliS [Defluviitaleaceae bacterium]|nr:flagellar protein FliS [Defluviitaleaceae bacterium]